MKKGLPVLIASFTGLTVLAGYYFQNKLAPLLGLMINWGILLAGLAGLMGVGYLIKMHGLRISSNQKGKGYSFLVLISFVFTLSMGLVLSPDHEFYRAWVLNIQTPIETSLLAIFAIILLTSSVYLIRTRGWTPMSIGFLVGALLALTSYIGILRITPGSLAEKWISFIQRLPLAGLRGIVIGMALGGLIVGLRVLLAAERPYDGK